MGGAGATAVSEGTLGYAEAVVLGVVQGVSEFLPISSTAHLKIVPELLGWGDPGAAASAVIQLGSTAALLVYYLRDLGALGLGALAGLRGSVGGRRDLRVLLGIALGTVPIVVAGLAFKQSIATTLRSTWVIAAALAGFALLLAIADRVAARPRRGAESLGVSDGLFVGIAQAFALVPGASRSGCTMTGAFFLGLDRAAAARYSFLLSIPAVSAAGLYELVKEWHSLRGAGLAPLAVATAVSGIVGYLSLGVLLRFLRTRSVLPFVYYRLALAALLVALLATGRLGAGSQF